MGEKHKGTVIQQTQDKPDWSNLPDWPIVPTFLSIRNGVKRSNISPNNDGLFYPNELRGILANATADILDISNNNGARNIFALFQIVEKGFDSEKEGTTDEWFCHFTDEGITKAEKLGVIKEDIIDEILNGREIIRIHPGNIHKNFDCCELFRKCAYKDKNNIKIGSEEDKIKCAWKCFEMDRRVALLYDISLPIIYNEKDWVIFNSILKNIIINYNKKILEEKYFQNNFTLHLDILEDSRPYIKYKCENSRLIECFFPIIHAGKVVSVLMFGQSVPDDIKLEEMFAEYRNENKKGGEEEERLDDCIINMNKEGFFSDNYKSIEEILSYDIKKIISKQIVQLETRINELVKSTSNDYVYKKFYEIEREFRDKVSSIVNSSISSGDKLENLRTEIEDLDKFLRDYKQILNETLDDILKKFNLNGFIRIYAIESPIANQVNVKKDGFHLIGDSSSNSEDSDSSGYSKIIFNKIRKRHGTLDKKELLDDQKHEAYFLEKYWKKVKGFNPHDDDIFRMEFPFSSKLAYIIWEKYDNLKKDSNHYGLYKNHLKMYNKHLNLMYHTLLEPYFILERMKLEKELENTMRITSHESAQIIPEVIDRINCPESLSFIKKEVGVYNGPIEIKHNSKIIIDVSRRLLLFQMLFKRLSNIFNNETPELKYCDFHRIIYAPLSLFERKAYLNKCQNIKIRMDENFSKYSLKTDYDVLSHVLFNIMDNAIKHGLQGSTIWINSYYHYKQELVDSNLKIRESITISVVSYGDNIIDEDREKLFDLYYRSKNVKETEGMSIGLFLVKKLCNLLGYEIECMQSIEIETYNVPLKYHYCMQNPKYASDMSLFVDTFEILKKQNKPEHYDVINMNDLSTDWETTVADLQREPNPMLFQPTYKNEFKITIPINEKNDFKFTNSIKSWEKYY